MPSQRASRSRRRRRAAGPWSSEMRAAPAELIEPFRHEGRLHKPLLILFMLVVALVLTNAILHDPRRGYDGKDHMNYIESLAMDWRLPTKAETGQYYSPPLPYGLPALLIALGA